MAVFTEVRRDEFAPWLLENYALELEGEPEPIAEGIENTNYAFVANARRYIFTVIEVWDEPTASYCIELAQHLHREVEEVPATLANCKTSKLYSSYAGKPAVAVDFVEGATRPAPSAADCQVAGGIIARLHNAAAGFGPQLPNPRGRSWRLEAASTVRPTLSAEHAAMLEQALAIDAELDASGLPRCACHCDLFRNNFLWRDDGRIAGVIDFYFAGEDFLMFDLAVAALDWAMDEDGAIDASKLAALLAGYREVRAPSDAECVAFSAAMVVGALRFWLSRLLDAMQPREAYALTPHDPEVFRRRLRQCLAQREELAAAMIK